MKTYRTPIAAAICCMALASGTVLAQSDTSRAPGSASSTMNRSDMGSSAARSGTSQLDRETVRQAQQALQSKGHNPGPIDGIMGPRTRAALQAYQRANNLTGARGLDQQTLSSLGVSASSSMAGGSPATRSPTDSGASAGGSGTASGGTGGSTTSRPDTGSGTTGSGTTGSRPSNGGSSGTSGTGTGAGTGSN